MSQPGNILTKRPFGRTGLMVSPLTFGAWSIGGPAEMGGKQIGWVGVNDDDAIDALRAACDAGVNLFDTADAYGRGHSEALLGRAFARGGLRDKVLISSKAGMIDDPHGFKLDFSRKHLTAACEGSLRRLQTGHLDVYLLHLVLDGHPLTDDIRETLDALTRQGKIRHYGVSVQFPHQGMEQLDRRFGDAMMIEYSPLKRGSGIEDVLVRAHNLGVGVITRGALEKGLLTGKYAPGHRFDARDVRSRIPGEQIDRVLAGVAELKAQAATERWSLLGMALQFQLAAPGCSTVTVGMKTRRQVDELVAAVGERNSYDFDRIIATLEGSVPRVTPLLDDIDIIDGHVHCYERAALPQLVADIRYTGARQFCVLVTDRMEGVSSGEQWENAVLLKRNHPGDAFLFGGLDIHSITEDGQAEPDVPFAEQLFDLMAAGCDGLKLLIGKPDRRKALRFPLDAPILEPMLSLAEQTRFPVLWHVGDPPEFWSEHTVPLWARQRGWWYDDTHPSKSQIDTEIARVFARHPKLNLILPHFFFLSDRLDDAATLLETYPSYALDLAPGVELYHNLTARHDVARDFFIRYADRILFGSDFGLPCGWSRDRGTMIRRFLETDDVFPVPDDPAMQPDDRPPLRGLALPREVLVQIYAENFRRRVGATPRPMSVGASKHPSIAVSE